MIIIFGAAGALVFLTLFIRSFSIFKRVNAILASVKVAVGNAEEISTMVRDEVVKPLAQVGCLLKSIQKWLEILGNLFHKPEKEVNDA
jgi:hypothetical protein